MRHTFIILVFFALLTFGCHTNNSKNSLEEIDSLVIAELYDSAYNLILSIDGTSFRTQEDIAHFNLLRVQTAYLVNKPMSSSDSILDSVISFYEKNLNSEKIADAYYYRAIGANHNLDYQQSILLYKKAELQAEKVQNMRLKFKIAEGISFVNGRCANYNFQLKYARQALELAKCVNNKNWIAYSLYRMGVAHSKLGNVDSVYYYFHLMEPYTNYLDMRELPVILSNLGFLYRDDNPKEAKKYLMESLLYKEYTNTYELLAEINYEEGNEDKAYLLWKKALTIQDGAPKDDVIHNLIEYDMERGKTDSICERINEIIAIRDSIDAKLKNDTIKDLQTRFDHEVAMREKDQTVIRWQWIAIILVVLLLLVVVYYLVRKYQARILLQKSQMQINDYMEQIRELKSDQGDQTTEITRLNKEVKRIMDERSPRLSQGRMLYDKIVRSEKMSRWQKDDVRKVIEYCTAINYRMVNRLKSVPRQHQLTPHQLLYLILVEMGKSDLEILQILSISKETLRGLRHKTKPLDESGSEKTDESL